MVDEIKLLKSNIDYNRNKIELDLQNSIKNMNERINRLVIEVNELREQLIKSNIMIDSIDDKIYQKIEVKDFNEEDRTEINKYINR